MIPRKRLRARRAHFRFTGILLHWYERLLTSPAILYPATYQVWLAIVCPALTQVPWGLHAGTHMLRFSGSWPFASVTFPHGPAVPQQEDPVWPPHVVV